MKNTFGHLLSHWRKQRRYSQLQLSVEIDVSSKHISFLETGRSSPSRQMILKLGTFLNVSKNEINNALMVAGFAPMYIQYEKPERDLKPVFVAMELMLKNHMPYPAIVLNKDWDIVNANQTAIQIMTDIGFAKYSNILQALIEDDPKLSKIVNWNYTVSHLLLRLKNEIATYGSSVKLRNLEKQLSQKISTKDQMRALDNQQPVLATQIKLKGEKYSLFSIIANLGAVQDVSIGDYKVELMFPNDEKTTKLFKIKS